jgi:hypothetical protein
LSFLSILPGGFLGINIYIHIFVITVLFSMNTIIVLISKQLVLFI